MQIIPQKTLRKLLPIHFNATGGKPRNFAPAFTRAQLHNLRRLTGRTKQATVLAAWRKLMGINQSRFDRAVTPALSTRIGQLIKERVDNAKTSFAEFLRSLSPGASTMLKKLFASRGATPALG